LGTIAHPLSTLSAKSKQPFLKKEIKARPAADRLVYSP